MGSCYIAQAAQCSTLWQPGGVGEEGQDGGDIGILTVDSRCCMAKANTVS